MLAFSDVQLDAQISAYAFTIKSRNSGESCGSMRRSTQLYVTRVSLHLIDGRPPRGEKAQLRSY
jgi:hypothetical protein